MDSYPALRFDGDALAAAATTAWSAFSRFSNDRLAPWRREGELPDSLDELRLVLFGEERRYKWTDIDGGPENMPFIRALLMRIRAMATAG